MKNRIEVEITVHSTLEKVWDFWNNPAHIVNWYFASDDWHAPLSENDLQAGGKFKTTMSAKDGSFSFDFTGEYTKVEPMKEIEYEITGGRKVQISFVKLEARVKVIEKFEPESENTLEIQKTGWQSILNNFKKLVENS